MFAWHHNSMERVWRGVARLARAGVCAAFLVLLLAPGVEAAARRSGSGWTLEKLVSAAIDRNPGLAASRAAATGIAEEIAAAKGQRLPRLDAVGKTEVFPRRERLLIFRHGFRKNDNTFQTAIVNYGLEVKVPLYTSGRIEHQISLAEARTEASRSRAELSRNELVFNVASVYYTALRLQRVVAAQETAVKSLGESHRILALQRAVGRVAPLDLLRLDVRVSQGERDLAGARNAYAQSLEFLKELIDVSADTLLEVTGELVPAPNNVEVAALREQAVARRPDVVALRHEVEARRQAVGVAAAGLGPSVDFSAGYRGVTGFNGGLTRDDATLFLNFRMPLYEGGVIRARKRKAKAELLQFELRLRAAERRALGELERAGLDLKSSEPRIGAARRAVSQAEESSRVERQKFGQGRGTSNDLLLAEEALLRARTEFAAALADSQIALAALKLAAGQDPVSPLMAPLSPADESD